MGGLIKQRLPTPFLDWHPRSCLDQDLDDFCGVFDFYDQQRAVVNIDDSGGYFDAWGNARDHGCPGDAQADCATTNVVTLSVYKEGEPTSCTCPCEILITAFPTHTHRGRVNPPGGLTTSGNIHVVCPQTPGLDAVAAGGIEVVDNQPFRIVYDSEHQAVEIPIQFDPDGYALAVVDPTGGLTGTTSSCRVDVSMYTSCSMNVYADGHWLNPLGYFTGQTFASAEAEIFNATPNLHIHAESCEECGDRDIDYP